MSFWKKLIFWKRRKDKVVQRYHYKPKPKTIKLFTYGTLKQGFHNHRYLKEDNYDKGKVKFLGETSYTGGVMYDYHGNYPIVVLGGSRKITGELYEVNKVVAKSIDRLEDYPHHYNRTLVRLDNGQRAWIYHQYIDKLKKQYGYLKIVKEGTWQKKDYH